jgi:hypothetical protein
MAAGLLLAVGAAIAFRPGSAAPPVVDRQATGQRGTIRIELTGRRARVEVRLDGERIKPADLGEPLRLTPGTHQLRISCASGASGSGP